jgi:ubiquinone/menaquinone biosynthesis C-methylase UbiE
MLPENSIPVALFVYRRDDVLAETLDALRKNRVRRIYAFSDGPKGRDDTPGVAAVRDRLAAIDWAEVKIVTRRHNLGLGRSILAGMQQMFAAHEAVLCLEDDIKLAPGAYDWVCAALDAYRDDERVMSISCWTHPAIIPDGVEAPYFDGKADCWGWASWRRSWQGMDLPTLEIVRMFAQKGGDIARYGPDLPVMAAEADHLNLWAVRFWYLHMLRGGLCLRPPYSLAENLGWDEHATTTTSAMSFWRTPPLAPAPQAPAIWPEPHEHSQCAFLWRAATLASGAGPFSEPGQTRARSGEDFDALYRGMAQAGELGWNDETTNDEVFAHFQRLLHFVKSKQSATLLELGCGAGGLTWRFANQGYEVTGVDISAAAIELARQRLAQNHCRAHLSVHDARRLDAFAFGRFDVVVDSLLLHNLVGIDRENYLESARRRLNNEGVFIVVSMCGRPRSPLLASRFDQRTGIIFDKEIAELSFHSPEALHQSLKQAGLEPFYEEVIAAAKEGDEDIYIAACRASPCKALAM